MPAFEQPNIQGLQKIVVHFASREDVTAFAELVGQSITDKTRFLWFPEQENVPYGHMETDVG